MADFSSSRPTLEVMADWHASGIWHVINTPGRRLREIQGPDIGLSPALTQALESWVHQYMALDYADEPDANAWQAFAAQGRNLADQIQVALPSHDVLYFDEHEWRHGRGRAVINLAKDKACSLQDTALSTSPDNPA